MVVTRSGRSSGNTAKAAAKRNEVSDKNQTRSKSPKKKNVVEPVVEVERVSPRKRGRKIKEQPAEIRKSITTRSAKVDHKEIEVKEKIPEERKRSPSKSPNKRGASPQVKPKPQTTKKTAKKIKSDLKDTEKDEASIRSTRRSSIRIQTKKEDDGLKVGKRSEGKSSNVPKIEVEEIEENEPTSKVTKKPIRNVKKAANRKQNKRNEDEAESEEEIKMDFVDEPEEAPAKVVKRTTNRKKAVKQYNSEIKSKQVEVESKPEPEADVAPKTRRLRNKPGNEEPPKDHYVEVKVSRTRQLRGRKRVLETKQDENELNEKTEEITPKKTKLEIQEKAVESKSLTEHVDMEQSSERDEVDELEDEKETVKEVISVEDNEAEEEEELKPEKETSEDNLVKPETKQDVNLKLTEEDKLEVEEKEKIETEEDEKIESEEEEKLEPEEEEKVEPEEEEKLEPEEEEKVEPEEEEKLEPEEEEKLEAEEEEEKLEDEEEETVQSLTDKLGESEEEDTEQEVPLKKPKLNKQVLEEVIESVEKKPAIRVKDLPICKLPEVYGQLMTFGDDTCGELGLSEIATSRSKPTLVEGLSSIASVFAGAMHTVCLNSDGRVLTFGCNDESALGRPTSDDNEAKPIQVPVQVPVVKITAGDSHTAALTENGAVYYWGNFRDQNGRIGLTQDSTESVLEPTPVKLGTTFVDTASGCNHLLLLSEKGEVYTAGVGEQGALGRLPEAECKFAKDVSSRFLIPRKIVVNKNEVFDKVWAGSYTSFARTVTGKVYAWGLNNFCQLGFRSNPADEPASSVEYFPKLLPSFTRSQAKVTHICGGNHHSLALDEEGRVYSCGRCEYGRLGHGENAGDEENFKYIDSLKEKVVYICCGPVCSFAVSEQGSLYAWGMASSSLGVGGGEIDLHVPTLVKAKSLANRSVLAVTSGSQHTAIIVTSGDGNHNGN